MDDELRRGKRRRKLIHEIDHGGVIATPATVIHQ